MISNAFLTNDLLIDRGFDAEFSWERIDALSRLFTDKDVLQQFVYDAHQRDNTFDLKRGEFYPELLRAIVSFKRTLSSIFGIDLIQVQPNFGSNGSIDTILGAAKIQETRRTKAWTEGKIRELKSSISQAGGQSTFTPETARLIEELQVSPSGGGVLMTSPTYFRNYNSASARDLAVNLVPLKPDYTFDTAGFVEKMKGLQPTAVFLVTPNNPTGIPIPDKDICAVLDELPANTWAVIDRTLVNTQPEISTVDLLKRYAYKNLAILHSFSKYKGMSHLRVGVALYSNSNFARLVQPHLPLGLALEGCIKANKTVVAEAGIYPDKEIVHRIRNNRALLDAFVRENPAFNITDFAGNYCLLILPDEVKADEISATLRTKGLYVMGGQEFPEPNSHVIRLHTGGPVEYMKKLCALIHVQYCKT